MEPGETTVVDAENTNAAYSYAPGEVAEVEKGFSLANAEFGGWNTSSDELVRLTNPEMRLK